MEVKQIYEIMNSVTNELLGESAVVAEDLSNIVELGQQFESVVGLDNYVRKLPDHVGRVIFVNRKYEGRAPRVLMDGWEFGSILEKIAARIPEAVENEDWTLQDGASYDPNVFHSPDVFGAFWNKRTTFEIDMSITEDQVKSSFSSVTQLNGFLSMILNAIETSLTIKLDSLIMRTINNMIGETFYAEFPAGTYTGTSTKAVNLLSLYNTTMFGESTSDYITAAAALHTPEFIRFASYTMANYVDRLKVASNLFNIGGETRFTGDSELHVIMLSEFKNAAAAYLQSDTFHNEYTALPEAESVVYWQGSGTGYDFSSTSEVKITTASGHSVDATGVLAVMFDRDALGVCNQERKVNTHYNEKASFWNYFYKQFAGYFNDTNENFVVFYVA
jgi:hypothetical protein